MYIVRFRGYDPPVNNFSSKREACKYLRECIQEDIDSATYKLAKIKHSSTHYETKIGNRQGYHTYSEGWVVNV